MSKNELSNRKNWQTQSGPSGLSGSAEKDVFKALCDNLNPDIFEVQDHPKHFKHLYEDVKLTANVLSEIFSPDDKAIKNAQMRGWGVSPDFAIINKKSNKILFGEIKRQDGWVEGKLPSAGRGNAHERMCKLFTPGLLKKYREISNLFSDDILPFWVILQGDITRDPKRNREIAFWFDKYDKNYFMWRPQMTDKDLIQHFNIYLKKYLD